MVPTLSWRKKQPECIRVLVLPAIALIFFSCFDTLVIVKTIPEKAALEEKIVAEPVATTDADLYALIKVLQVSKPLKLQWHWYAPDKKLLRQSKTVEINAKGKFLSYFVAWDALPQTYYAEKKGRWTVLITADGSFLAKTEFEVN
jgi:hypothetical protein